MRDFKGVRSGGLFIFPVISGVLLALTLPPFNITVLVWYALIPLFLFISTLRVSPKKIFWGGVITGIIYSGKVAYPLLSLNAWGWLKVSGIMEESKVLILFLLLSVMVFFSSILFGLFSLLFRRFARENVLLLIPLVVLPLSFVLFEYLRAKIFLGFTWGNLGYTLHGSPYLLQLSDFGGVYALSFLVVFVNSILFLIIRKTLSDVITIKNTDLFRAVRNSFFRNPYLYILLCVILLVNAYGYFSIKNVLPVPTPLSRVSIAIIQPGHNTESEADIFQNIAKALKKNPEIILIPESAFPSIILNEEAPRLRTTYPRATDSYWRLFNLSETHPGTSFVVGLISVQGESRYSSLVALEGGHVTSIYHKRTLFPFSERTIAWFPFKTIGALMEGKNAGEIMIKGNTASALICSEILFPELIKDNTSRFVVSVGNDGVFDSPVVAEQNHIIAKFTAVSTHKYLVRAMKTGVSSIIDPYGRDLVRSHSQEKELLYGWVSLP